MDQTRSNYQLQGMKMQGKKVIRRGETNDTGTRTHICMDITNGTHHQLRIICTSMDDDGLLLVVY